MNENIIEVRNLSLAYNSSYALENVSLNIKKNSRTAIIGPNGAGKSSLVKAILGLVDYQIGNIKIDSKIKNNKSRAIAYVPQISSVNWDFPTTAFDVVLMGRYKGLFKGYDAIDRDLAMKALVEMEMDEYKDRQISELSGGQRQRVFIARAIAQEADIYMMDEPLAGVDKNTEEIIMKKFKKLQEDEKTVIAVHHDLNSLKKYFDHLVIINKTIKASGDIDDALNIENILLAYS